MKVRNTNVAKRLGMKTLAGLLAVGMAFGSPVAVLADEMPVAEEVVAAEENAEVAESEIPTQAKALDDTDTYVDISEEVQGMIERGEVVLDEESGYLLDAETGEKVDPVTGERQTEPEEPEKPTTPDDSKDNSEKPDDSGKTDTPDTPTPTPAPSEEPSEPETPQTPAQDDSTTDTSGDNEEVVEEPGTPEEIQEAEEIVAEDPDASESNSELISKQQIVKVPEIVEDFRFWTVARKYAFAKKDLTIREEMPKAIEEDAKAKMSEKEIAEAEKKAEEKIRAVGKLSKDGLLYILKEEDNGWCYVESGGVRGFVKVSEVLTGDDAETLLKEYQTKAKEAAKKQKKEYKGIEGTAKTAEALVSPLENKAYTYLRATVNQTVIKKQYALVNASVLNVREEQNKKSKIVGKLKKGSLCYIIADKDSEWIYIESGDVRGFVKKEYIDTGDKVTEKVQKAGEDSFETAEQLVESEENKALYYTLTSIKSGTPDGEIRSSIVEFASQFIGNPYVWGGTSLTDGADCSGFVQQIYKQYGYDLPRVSADQSQYGTKIAVEDAQPGDLIFYAKKGKVYHVVMYAGDGKTIEAANEKQGIIQGKVYSKDAVWATRILNDNYTVAGAGISEVNATEDMYGEKLGNFKITYYCSCEICCNKADGITATGTPVVEGQTIAVDPSVIPYGTQVIIGGHVFTAEDCGGAIKQNHIDVYVNSHEEALALGVANADVYLVK
nr:NlpC/P60 family protein [uncultured Mediterraneibacter sp.]